MIIETIARHAQLDIAGAHDNPIFAWDNLAKGKTLGGTATLTGGDAFNATNGTTADFWLPNVTGTTADFTVDLGAATALNFAAIASHNVNELAGSAQIDCSSDNSAWTAVGAVTTPDDGSPMAWRFASTSARYWRLRVSGLTVSDPLAVGVAFFGVETILPQRAYQDVSPPITPNMVEIASNVSVGGNLMGSSTVSQGYTVPHNFNHIQPAFIRGVFKPFIQHFNEGRGFFMAWRPHKYPEDIIYGWREGGVIVPSNTGVLDRMTFSMQIRAHNGG